MAGELSPSGVNRWMMEGVKRDWRVCFMLRGPELCRTMGVVGVLGTERAGQVLGTEEREVVSHWEDLGLPVKV